MGPQIAIKTIDAARKRVAVVVRRHGLDPQIWTWRHHAYEATLLMRSQCAGQAFAWLRRIDQRLEEGFAIPIRQFERFVLGDGPVSCEGAEKIVQLPQRLLRFFR